MMSKRSICFRPEHGRRRNGISADAARADVGGGKLIGATGYNRLRCRLAQQTPETRRADGGARDRHSMATATSLTNRVHQQRENGCRQHDGIGRGRSALAVSDKTWSDFSKYLRSVFLLVFFFCRNSAPLGSSCEIREPPASHRSKAENRGSSAMVYSRLTVPLVPSTDTRLSWRASRPVDRRHRPEQRASCRHLRR